VQRASETGPYNKSLEGGDGFKLLGIAWS
jgi:hypothetical protein